MQYKTLMVTTGEQAGTTAGSKNLKKRINLRDLQLNNECNLLK